MVPSPGLQELNDDIVRQHPDVSWAGSPAKADMPSGTVTFLVTEVEGSRRLWEEYPDVMRHTMACHDELLRDAVESHDGFIVKNGGDGFHAVFATAHDAVTVRSPHKGRSSRTTGTSRRLCASGWGFTRARPRFTAATTASAP